MGGNYQTWVPEIRSQTRTSAYEQDSRQPIPTQMMYREGGGADNFIIPEDTPIQILNQPQPITATTTTSNNLINFNPNTDISARPVVFYKSETGQPNFTTNQNNNQNFNNNNNKKISTASSEVNSNSTTEDGKSDK